MYTAGVTQTPRTRRHLPGQQALTFGMLAERPGSQLDLIAEAGLEDVGPSTITAPEPQAGHPS
jgi:hypothetical protein